jgi:hypothetical protein
MNYEEATPRLQEGSKLGPDSPSFDYVCIWARKYGVGREGVLAPFFSIDAGP